MDINDRPISQARVVGNLVFLSGQIGMWGGRIVTGGIKEETVRAIRNMEMRLECCDLSLNNVVDVAVFLIDEDDFEQCREVWAQTFKRPYPAASCAIVKSLPYGARVQIKALAIK